MDRMHQRIKSKLYIHNIIMDHGGSYMIFEMVFIYVLYVVVVFNTLLSYAKKVKGSKTYTSWKYIRMYKYVQKVMKFQRNSNNKNNTNKQCIIYSLLES